MYAISVAILRRLERSTGGNFVYDMRFLSEVVFSVLYSHHSTMQKKRTSLKEIAYHKQSFHLWHFLLVVESTHSFILLYYLISMYGYCLIQGFLFLFCFLAFYIVHSFVHTNLAQKIKEQISTLLMCKTKIDIYCWHFSFFLFIF